jgi:hypothetical protein
MKEAASEALAGLLPGPGGGENPAGLFSRVRKLMFDEVLVVKTQEGTRPGRS